MYPMVVILAMLGIGALMLITVVPNLAATFTEFNMELPATTKLVIALGAFLSEKWYFIILMLIGLALFLSFTPKSKKSAKIIDTLILKIPVISPIIKMTNSAYMTRTLSSLIKSGVPIVRSLEIVSKSLGNFYFRQAIFNASKAVKKGDKLSDVLSPCQNLFSSTTIQMIKVGEETGQTSDILAKLADFFEQEAMASTQNLASVIEPIIMLVIGGAVGFFAVSMIQPMYSMLGSM